MCKVPLTDVVCWFTITVSVAVLLAFKPSSIVIVIVLFADEFPKNVFALETVHWPVVLTVNVLPDIDAVSYTHLRAHET